MKPSFELMELILALPPASISIQYTQPILFQQHMAVIGLVTERLSYQCVFSVSTLFTHTDLLTTGTRIQAVHVDLVVTSSAVVRNSHGELTPCNPVRCRQSTKVKG